MLVIADNIGNSTGSVNGYFTGCDSIPHRSFYRPMLGAVVQRIDQRLKAVGLSATAASRMAGLSEDAIRNMKRAAKGPDNRQGVSTRTLAALAPVLQTTAGWLLEGVGEEEQAGPPLSPVVGYVGAGALAHLFAQGQGPFDYVPRPEWGNESTVAVEIRGESLGSFFDSWLVFYDDVRSPITQDLIGKLCVVGLPDDRILVKKVMRSKAPGLFHLLSQQEEPIMDVEVSWAALVKEMRPR